MSSKTGTGPCVYTTPRGLCPGSSPLHPKEHYLPAGLGNFKHDVRLHNYICKDCQRNFGSLEDVFLHTSPEAFFRFITGRKGRKRHRKKDIFYEPTAGMAPIKIKALQPGQSYPVLWEMMGTGRIEARQMKQVVFKDSKGDFHHLPYRPGHLPQDLSRFLNRGQADELEIVGYFCDDDAEANEIRNVCAQFLTGKKELPVDPCVGANVQAELVAAITIPYLRAVAKIAFHFVLAHFDFTGLERQFDDIKRFIFTGENYRRFVQAVQEPFVRQLQDPQAFTTGWCHLLSAQYDFKTMEARMQFFSGPVVKPFVWRVIFRQSPFRVFGTHSKAFLYRYYDRPDRQGYDGEKTQLEAARITPA